MRRLFIAVLVLNIPIYAWSEESAPTTGQGGLAFYFVADASLTASQIRDASLNSLKLQEKPFFTSRELLSYDVSAHALYLTPVGFKQLTTPFMEQGRALIHGLPFVVMAEGKRCYVGAFISSFSSFGLDLPCITDFSYLRNRPGLNRIIMEGGYPTIHARDQRPNPRIIAVLKKEGLYHEGISGQIIDADISGAKLTFTYEMQNRDTRPLCVLDPDKAPGSLTFFRYGSLGTQQTIDKKQIVLNLGWPLGAPDRVTETEARKWLESFTDIPPGQSMKRTLIYNGLPENVHRDSMVVVWYIINPYTVGAILDSLHADEVRDATPILERMWWGDLKMKPAVAQ